MMGSGTQLYQTVRLTIHAGPRRRPGGRQTLGRVRGNGTDRQILERLEGNDIDRQTLGKLVKHGV